MDAYQERQNQFSGSGIIVQLGQIPSSGRSVGNALGKPARVGLLLVVDDLAVLLLLPHLDSEQAATS